MKDVSILSGRPVVWLFVTRLDRKVVERIRRSLIHRLRLLDGSTDGRRRGVAAILKSF